MKIFFHETISRISKNEKLQNWFWWGLIALLIAIFFAVASEIRGSASPHDLVAEIDDILQRWAFAERRPWLNAAAMDLTALGSTTVLTIVTVVFFTGMSLLSKRDIAMQMAVAAMGAGILSGVTKNIFGRERPPAISRLVEVEGFSYPSGHSLSAAAVYLTMALLACRFFRRRSERLVIGGMACALMVGIGVSRIYLGAHFPSDVAGGMALGSAWALFLNLVWVMAARGRRAVACGGE